MVKPKKELQLETIGRFVIIEPLTITFHAKRPFTLALHRPVGVLISFHSQHVGALTVKNKPTTVHTQNLSKQGLGILHRRHGTAGAQAIGNRGLPKTELENLKP